MQKLSRVGALKTKMGDKYRTTKLLSALCRNTATLKDMSITLDVHSEQDTLLPLFEQWSRDAQHFLIVGLHKARELEYNEASIRNQVTGHARYVALSACRDSETGHEVLWNVIQSVAAEEEARVTELEV